MTAAPTRNGLPTNQPSPRDVHPVIRAWVTYLLSSQFTDLVNASLHTGEPLEVALFTARGRVRKVPKITFGGSTQEMVDPS